MNKALRTTVKAFLKKKGIERETLRKKEESARLASEKAPIEEDSNVVDSHVLDAGKDSGVVAIDHNKSNGEGPIEPHPSDGPVKDDETQDDVIGEANGDEGHMDFPRPSVEASHLTFNTSTSADINLVWR